MAKNTELEKFLLGLPINQLEKFFLGIEAKEEASDSYCLYRMEDGGLVEVDLQNYKFKTAYTIDEDTGDIEGTLSVLELVGYE